MRGVLVCLLLGSIGALQPASAECYGKWPALVCIDPESEDGGVVITPSGSFSLDDTRQGSGIARYPNARAAPPAKTGATSATGSSAVAQPSGGADAASLMTPNPSGGGTVVQGGSGGGTVVTCGPSGTCQ